MAGWSDANDIALALRFNSDSYNLQQIAWAWRDMHLAAGQGANSWHHTSIETGIARIGVHPIFRDVSRDRPEKLACLIRMV